MPALLTRSKVESVPASASSDDGMQPDDAALLAATGDGDREALAALYARHSPWLLLRLSRRCGDPGVVDEVVQDTFVAVWRSARRYDGRGDVAAWIWGIAARRLVDALRRAPAATVALPDHGLGDGHGHGTDAVEPSAEERVLVDVRYGDVGAALERLSPELRAVVQATVLDGLSTREAATLLGIPSGTVKTRMMRARAQLRGALA